MFPQGSYYDTPSAGSHSASKFSLGDLTWALIHREQNYHVLFAYVKSQYSPKGGDCCHFEQTRTQIVRKKTSTFGEDGYR